MEEERILLIFRQLAGLDAPEAEGWRMLCSAAGAYVRSLLKEGANTPENAERIHTAAAFIAYSRYCEIEGLREAGAVRVGDVSITPPDYSGRAQGMERAILGLFADLLRPSGFIFMQTEVQAGADDKQA